MGLYFVRRIKHFTNKRIKDQWKYPFIFHAAGALIGVITVMIKS